MKGPHRRLCDLT